MIDWYQLGGGNKAVLSRTLEDGILRERTIWAPLKASVSMLFGEQSASIRGLQISANRLARGLPIICDTCQRPIWPYGEDRDNRPGDFGHDSIRCEILLRYSKVMARIDTGELVSNRVI